jgi:hypothetical protein
MISGPDLSDAGTLGSHRSAASSAGGSRNQLLSEEAHRAPPDQRKERQHAFEKKIPRGVSSRGNSIG